MHLCPHTYAPCIPLARKEGVPPWKMPRRVSPANILRLVREILDAGEPDAIRWIKATWSEQAASLTDEAISAALASGHVPESVIERFVASYRKLVDEKLTEAMTRSAAKTGELIAERFGMTLDGRPSPAILGRMSRLPVEIGPETGRALDVVIRYHTQTSQGTAGAVAADIRKFIGLTSREANAVTNMRIDATLSGMTPAQIAQATTNYTSHLRQARALRIARTELAFATSQGQRDAILQAQREGYVGPDVRREWSAADDEVTCPVCGELDGQSAAMGEPFRLGGVEYYDPPSHPNCRCVAVYIDLVPKE